jgi:hypothetical protein
MFWTWSNLGLFGAKTAFWGAKTGKKWAVAVTDE